MKLLADQDVYAATVAFLRGLGHDVDTAAERGLSRAADTDLLSSAYADGRVFVTRDRDYGGLVFVQALGSGVLYLRVLPSTLQAVHAELERVLGLYSEAELQGAFVVVEPGRHRVRRAAIGDVAPNVEPSSRPGCYAPGPSTAADFSSSGNRRGVDEPS